MASSVHPSDVSARARSIGAPASALPINIPVGHIGPVVLPGSNRQIWWTGRVAIGLRYERRGEPAVLSQSAAWIQDVLLGDAPHAAAR